MSKLDSEKLFSRIIKRWTNPNLESFERDFADDVEVLFNQYRLTLQELKERMEAFHEMYDAVDLVIKDVIYDEDKFAVRCYAKIRDKKTSIEEEDDFFIFYQVKNNLVIKYAEITKFDFNFKTPKTI